MPAVEARRSDTEEREFVVETQQVRAVFTNRGGRLKRWALTEYPDRAGQFVDRVELAIQSRRERDATAWLGVQAGCLRSGGE